MGFLSKLFGGDAASGKAADQPASSPAGLAHALTPGHAAANQVDLQPREAAAPEVNSIPDVAEPALPRRAPVLTGEHPADKGLDTPLRAPPASTLAAATSPPRSALRAEPGDQQDVAPSSAREPANASPSTPRRAPDTPRRSAQLESSIITSAPLLGGEPQRAPVAPRPALGGKPARAAADAPRPARAEPNPPGRAESAAATTEAARDGNANEAGAAPRAAMSSVSGEAGLLGSARRKDRSKSPGFYSNVAPAFGARVVSPGASQSIKRTAIGLAPPPEASAAALAAKPPAAGLDGASAAVRAAALPAEPAAAAVPSTVASTDVPARDLGEPANDAGPVAASPATDEGNTSELAAKDAPDSAPPQLATDELEKEETAPGVGHTPSRHDPVLRGDIPERDLDVLVHFVMDLGLGLASETWLAPVRDALGRLSLAAAKIQRAALDKALVQFGVELDAPNALAEERRARIAQQLVLVDLALPRPMDVSGQRSLRERLIVQHLLSELSVAHPLIAQRLRDEGSLTLERFARLGAAELAERVGISPEQADHALFAFREYLLERARRGPDIWLLGKAQALTQRLAELEASARLFESVADGDDVQAKREARRKRQAAISRVSLFLAECGEAGILGEFERSSVQGKIARLRRWLGELPAS